MLIPLFCSNHLLPVLQYPIVVGCHRLHERPRYRRSPWPIDTPGLTNPGQVVHVYSLFNNNIFRPLIPHPSLPAPQSLHVMCGRQRRLQHWIRDNGAKVLALEVEPVFSSFHPFIPTSPTVLCDCTPIRTPPTSSATTCIRPRLEKPGSELGRHVLLLWRLLCLSRGTWLNPLCTSHGRGACKTVTDFRNQYRTWFLLC